MTDQYADALLKQRDAFRKNMSSAADKLPMKRAAAEMDNNNQPTTAITTTSSSSSFSAFGSPINSMNASMPNMANMRGFGGFGGIGKPDPFSTDLKKPFLMNMMPKPTGSESVLTNIQQKIVNFLKDKHRNKALGITFQFTLAEILSEINERMLTIQEQNELISRLVSNPKLVFEDDKFSFLPKYQVENKEDLVELLRQYYMQGHGGITLADLSESYNGVEKDAEELEKEMRIFKLPTKEQRGGFSLFYNDPRLNIELDNDFKTMWGQLSLPSNIDIKNTLTKAGIQPLKVVLPTDQDQDNAKGKKTAARRITKYTNTHLTNIDLTKDLEVRK